MDKSEIEKSTDSVEQIVRECGVEALMSVPKFAQALRMAYGMKELRKALTDEFMQKYIAPLCGTKLGFLTDKDKDPPDQKYSIHVVRDCCVEALMRGFNLVGNEFNIIAGQFYGAKAGYERKVLEWPGLTNLLMEPAVPAMANGGALVAYVAHWRLKGEPQSMRCLQENVDGAIIDNRIPVKINSGMGADAILGKAERKMYYRIYKRLSGGAFGLVDGEMGESILASGEPAPSPLPAGTPQGQRISLKGSKTKGAAASAPAAGSGTPDPVKPAAAPAEPVDLVELHEALAEVDEQAWAGPGCSAVIAAWTPDQQLEAMTWAKACLDNAPMAEQAKRPKHTLMTARQPGED